jgi:hypothetical protein
VCLAAVGDPLADNDAGIADPRCRCQDIEISSAQIAKRVEVEHLAVRVKERARGVIACGGGSDDHSGCVMALPGNAHSCAGGSTESPQIGDAVA